MKAQRGVVVWLYTFFNLGTDGYGVTPVLNVLFMVACM